MASPGKQLTPEQQEAILHRLFDSNKGASIGPPFIGVVLNCFLLGITLVQVVRYFGHSQNDRPFTRTIVILNMTAAIGYSIYTAVLLMQQFVYGFGTYASFLSAKPPAILTSFQIVMILLVQSFYAERAYRLLGKNIYFLVAFGIMAAAELTSALCLIIMSQVKPRTLTDSSVLTPFLTAWLSVQLGADIFITACMTWAMLRSKTGWSETNKLITKIVAFTLEIQLPSLVIALVFLIVFLCTPGTTTFIALDLAMPLPYVIGMLAVLNARTSWRRGVSQNSTGVEKNTYALSSGRPQQATVHVSTETYSQTRPEVSNMGTNGQQGDEDRKTSLAAESTNAESLESDRESTARLTHYA